MSNTMALEYLKELESEITATRKCLERIPAESFGWKPHERSMSMGDLSSLVADMPRWLSFIIEKGEVDFATYSYFNPKSTSELVSFFDENIKNAVKSLQNVSDEALKEMFYLKNQDQVLFVSSKKENVGQTINHLVHHRGQLTVYMRLNDIAVPSVYGPSADEKTF